MRPDLTGLPRPANRERPEMMNDAARPETAPELRAEAGPLSVPLPGTLWLEMDLRAVAFVNLDFRAASGRSIPLHLSLRRDQGLIIANRWTPKGWRREVAFIAGLGHAVHDLRLDFTTGLSTGTSVTLSLDGNRLGRLDARPRRDRTARLGLRRGFSGLADLGWMTWPDGLRSMRVSSASPASPLHLTSRLELGLFGAQSGAMCDLGDGGALLPFIPLDMASDARGRGVSHVLLPGRLWRGCGADRVPLIVRDATGREIARKDLHRRDILAVLQRPEIPWLARHDALVRLQLLEHVHFAGLWSEIPAALGDVLASGAMSVIKAGFAPPVETRFGAGNTAPIPAAGLACDAFHRAIADGYSGDPEALCHRCIHAHDLSRADLRQFVLMLSEWFCLNADPRRLADAAREHGVSDWARVRDPWGELAALPMLWAHGDWPSCLQVLRRARAQSRGWTVTPALGWIASALAQDLPGLNGERPDLAERAALMAALMEMVAALAPAHMSQMGCHRLIKGVCDLLETALDLPDWCAPHFADLALRAYGLNPDFWDHLELRAGVLPRQLSDWKTAFAQLRQACLSGDPAQLTEAARPFLCEPVAGRDTLRRLVLSDAGLMRDGAEPPDFSRWSGIVPKDQLEESALRWLAFPRSRTAHDALSLSTDTAIHRAACAGLRGAAADVARPQMSQAMQCLGAPVQAMLGRIRAGQVPSIDAVSHISERARKLAVPQAGFVGVAALLALAEALSRAAAPEQARQCIDVALSGEVPAGVLQCHAAKLALARFAAFCPDTVLRARVAATFAPDMALAPPPAEDARAAKLRADANPFADTLVALISCRAYLGNRVPEIKAAWGDDLARLGVPMITVVGRGADQLPGCGHRFDGHVLELDAPDDYEGLPQKILALADWVLTQTGFGRVFKIDDDCFLNAEAFFNDPAFLTVPYFGRPLRRNRGEMDRSWHMGRAQSARGRCELDKSPEPSVYADGGSGYILTRPALAALIAARKSVQGQSLEQVSFMEDKLVGDLLALKTITVAGPNYDMAIFRKSTPGLPPLPQYQNSFLPFAGSDIKFAHLDADGAPMAARAALASPWPSPMKIWPCHSPARLGWARNALDLISPPDRLDAARDAELAVISVMRNERFMLDHFLSHYRQLGVSAFLIVDNGSDDGTLEHLVAQPDVSVFSTDTPYRQSAYGVVWQEALLAQVRLGRWTLLADADELAFWSLPEGDGRVQGDFPALLRGAEFAGAEAVRLFMLDLYPKGPMAEARFDQSPFLEAGHIDRAPLRHDWQGRGPWSNSATVTSALRHRLMEEARAPARANLFVAQKYALLRYHPFMRLSSGLHYVAGAKVASRDLGFAHFKYHAQFHAKAVAEVARGQHFNNAEEYRSYLRLLAQGRDTLFDPALSVRFSDCATVRALCGLAQDATVAAFRPAVPARARPVVNWPAGWLAATPPVPPAIRVS